VRVSIILEIDIESFSEYLNTDIIENFYEEFLKGSINCFMCWLSDKLTPSCQIYEHDIAQVIKDYGRRGLHAVMDSTFVHSYSFDSINKLTKLKYEGSTLNKSRLCITNNTDIIERCYDIKMIKPVKLTDSVLSRKLLEISHKDFVLVSDGENIYSYVSHERLVKYIAQTTKRYQKQRILRQCNMFIIDFVSQNKWTISYYDYREGLKKDFIIVDNTIPKFKLDNNDEKILDIYNSIFEIHTFSSKHQLIVEAASKQKKGAIIVFLEDAVSEAKRLQTGFPIKQRKNIGFADRIIQHITTIDGAVICNADGDIFTFGVILDGNKSEKAEEDQSRGARYNSSIKYSASLNQKCLIMVVSEDGYIDLISKGKKIASIK